MLRDRGQGVIAGLALLVIALPPCTALAQSETDAGGTAVEEMRRRLDVLQQRLEATEAGRREDAARIRALEAEVERLKVSAPVAATGVSPERRAVDTETREGPALAGEAVEPAGIPAETAERRPQDTSPGMVDRLNAFNPRLTVIGNGLLRLDDRKVFTEDDGSFERVDSRFRLREAELDLRAAIDPYADGLLIVAIEQEPTGEFETSVEEGYALVKHAPFLEQPPLGLQAKLGRFRTEFGRLNRLHTHDLPQSTRPLALKTFLGSEGYIADGASTRLLLPSVLDRESAWELTAQLVQGGSVNVAEARNDPNVLANLRWSRAFGDAHLADLAGIFDRGTTDEASDGHAYTYSLDWMYKWKPPRYGEWRSALLGGQLFYSDRDVTVPGPGGPVDRSRSPFGYFVFAQYQLDPRWYGGVRWDWTEDITDTDARRFAVHPYLTYYFTEFLRFRLGYEHRWNRNNAQDDLNTVFGEMNFVFGSHPPEPFWVNR